MNSGICFEIHYACLKIVVVNMKRVRTIRIIVWNYGDIALNCFQFPTFFFCGGVAKTGSSPTV